MLLQKCHSQIASLLRHKLEPLHQLLIAHVIKPLANVVRLQRPDTFAAQALDDFVARQVRAVDGEGVHGATAFPSARARAWPAMFRMRLFATSKLAQLSSVKLQSFSCLSASRVASKLPTARTISSALASASSGDSPP